MNKITLDTLQLACSLMKEISVLVKLMIDKLKRETGELAASVIRGDLEEQIDDTCATQPLTAMLIDGQLQIKAKGYSNSCEDDGCIMVVELYEGQLRFMAWQDQENDEPTTIGHFENAKIKEN